MLALGAAPPARAQKIPDLGPTKGSRVGDLAPDFSLPDLDGRTFTLAKLRGERVVQVVFWATWCVPCIDEIPKLRAAYDRYHERGLEILGVVAPSSQTREGVRAFAEKFRINYPILWDERSSMTDRYGVVSLPQNFLIDRSGVIRHAGAALPGDYEKQIETLLGESAARKERRVEARARPPLR